MAENLRSVDVIMAELFEGLRTTKRDGTTKKEEAALKKYEKVRWVQFEMNYYRKHILPLSEIHAQAKMYFSKRFLDGEYISQVDPTDLEKAYKSLDHAVNDGCHGRCYRLVVELNEALTSNGVRSVGDIEALLNWLTFSPVERKDSEGNPIMEKPYYIPVVDFTNREHLEQFYKVWKEYYKKGFLLSMQDTFRIVDIMSKSKKLPKTAKK